MAAQPMGVGSNTTSNVLPIWLRGSLVLLTAYGLLPSRYSTHPLAALSKCLNVARHTVWVSLTLHALSGAGGLVDGFRVVFRSSTTPRLTIGVSSFMVVGGMYVLVLVG